MANIKGMIVAELNRKRLALISSLEGMDKLIAEFGGNGKVKGKRHRRTKAEMAQAADGTANDAPKKRTLTPEQIAKMQAGRKKKAPATEGANLAAAAGE
jgi:hypothetical protein